MTVPHGGTDVAPLARSLRGRLESCATDATRTSRSCSCVLAKLAFRYEGRQLQSLDIRGSWYDADIFGLLPSGWVLRGGTEAGAAPIG